MSGLAIPDGYNLDGCYAAITAAIEAEDFTGTNVCGEAFIRKSDGLLEGCFINYSTGDESFEARRVDTGCSETSASCAHAWRWSGTEGLELLCDVGNEGCNDPPAVTPDEDTGEQDVGDEDAGEEEDGDDEETLAVKVTASAMALAAIAITNI